jgi:hypothetical protein
MNPSLLNRPRLSTYVFMMALFVAAIIGLALAPAQSHAGPLSNYLEEKLIEHVFQNTAYTSPTTLAVALGTACSDASFTELANTGGYARVSVAANDTNWTGPTTNDGTVANGIAVTFPTATADWNSGSTIGYWALFDSATYGAGNLIVCAALTTARAVMNGSTPSFAIGALTVQFDN